MSIHPRYIVQNGEPQSSLTSSISVLRTIDNEVFLASQIPKTLTKNPKNDQVRTPLAACLIPSAGIPLSRILNHANIISLVDIVQTSSLAGSTSLAGQHGDLTVWEDMNAGSLAYLLPSLNAMPDFSDEAGWHALSSQDFRRFSLPESLCWHVLVSISRALVWLHHGIKETEGIRNEWMPHDDDWHPILIRDISPGQVWFKKPRGEETYGECKLGGFHWAKVTGSVGGQVAIAPRVEEASREKQFYWAPEIYKHTHSHSRAAEIWSLGAVIYTMMTGIPPTRFYDYNWQISRLNDKGFSRGLREIVADMMNPIISRRPDALALVDRVDDCWRGWRANSREGRECVNARDNL